MSRRGGFQPRKGHQSIAVPTIFTSPADKPKPDTRQKTMNQNAYASTGRDFTCTCGAEVKLVLAVFTDPELEIYNKKTRIIPNHRLGGGNWSARRGDNRCPNSQRRPDDLRYEG